MKLIAQIDTRPFYSSSYLNDSEFHIKITDLKSLWKVELHLEELIKIFKEMNPLMLLSDQKIIDLVNSLLSDSGCCELEEKENHLEIILSRKVGIKIKLKFSLMKCSSDNFCDEVTLPLIFVVNQLSEQQKRLCSLLKSKDLELKEYKMEGADISRRNVITGEFNEEIFQNECNEKFTMSDIDINQPLVLSKEIGDLYSETCRKIMKAKLATIKQEPSYEEPENDFIPNNKTETPEVKQENLEAKEIKTEMKRPASSIETNIQRIKKPRKKFCL